ncbi:MAG: M48 family metallopeptidase [Acidobacteria bacterium]|nr:M48 family metallopeptidase [Acidobacteriota bacterium]
MLSFSAHYFDGRLTDPVPARATPQAGGVSIEIPSGTLFWPGDSFRVAGAGPPVSLATLAQPVQSLVVQDRRFLDQIVYHHPAHAQPRRRNPALTAAFSLLGALALLAISLPFLAGFLVILIPNSWEERLGRLAFEAHTQGTPVCATPPIIETIVERLDRGGEFSFRVTVLDDLQVNAFALPGGRIGVYRGLLERLRSPEELAAVLAHEIEHVTQRHSTSALLRTLSLGALITLVTGEPGAATEIGRQLASLHFSRQAEEQADRAGARRLARAGIHPEAMIRVFELLESLAAAAPPAYLSTHPPAAARREIIRDEVAGLKVFSRPLPDAAWPPPRQSCR